MTKLFYKYPLYNYGSLFYKKKEKAKLNLYNKNINTRKLFKINYNN